MVARSFRTYPDNSCRAEPFVQAVRFSARRGPGHKVRPYIPSAGAGHLARALVFVRAASGLGSAALSRRATRTFAALQVRRQLQIKVVRVGRTDRVQALLDVVAAEVVAEADLDLRVRRNAQPTTRSISWPSSCS